MSLLEIVDTHSRPWESWYPQYPGTKCKTLFEDQETGENLKLAFVPSGFSPGQHTRHHHGTTREFVYLLFGDLPYVEYASPSAPPRVFTFAAGMLLDRPPFSIHGMSVDPVSSVGALVLEWTTGENVFNSVPFDDPPEDDGSFSDPWVGNIAEGDWCPHPDVPAWSVKVLSKGPKEPVPGYHPVSIVHLPGDWRPENGEAAFALSGQARPWFYVLEGSGRMTLQNELQEEHVDLQSGVWVRWEPGVKASFGERWTDDVHLRLLCVGHSLV